MEAIFGIDLDRVTWTPIDPTGAAGEASRDVFVAILWEDPQTGAVARLVKTPPGWSDPVPEWHSCTQHQFLIEGDHQLGPVAMKAGTYLCLPPRTVHGPSTTRAGYTTLSINDGPVDVNRVPHLKHGDVAPLDA